MQFPYGLSDFSTLRRDGDWHQDRTDIMKEHVLLVPAQGEG